jgi:signal transduction histidine kinase
VPAAWCDRDALAQVAQNLLDNAARHAASAADRLLRVRVERAGRGVEVSVDDAGPGVPAGERERIFAPFVRGARADGVVGLGLGLSLSRSVARACGGDLRCEEGPRGGARFVLSLSPAAED